jgi:hypothetical protein
MKVYVRRVMQQFKYSDFNLKSAREIKGELGKLQTLLSLKGFKNGLEGVKQDLKLLSPLYPPSTLTQIAKKLEVLETYAD